MRVGIPVCNQSFRFSEKKRQATTDETGQFRVVASVAGLGLLVGGAIF
jgi:hypothetical protein